MDPRLTAMAGEKIASGDLPRSPTVVCWAGPGGGETCALCGEPVPRSEIAFELQLTGRTAVLHSDCHSAWLAAAGTP